MTVLYRQVLMSIGPLKTVIEPIAVRVNRIVNSILEVPTPTTGALLFLVQAGLLIATWWWFGRSVRCL